jgi:hypothetical protein
MRFPVGCQARRSALAAPWGVPVTERCSRGDCTPRGTRMTPELMRLVCRDLVPTSLPSGDHGSQSPLCCRDRHVRRRLHHRERTRLPRECLGAGSPAPQNASGRRPKRPAWNGTTVLIALPWGLC